MYENTLGQLHAFFLSLCSPPPPLLDILTSISQSILMIPQQGHVILVSPTVASSKLSTYPDVSLDYRILSKGIFSEYGTHPKSLK